MEEHTLQLPESTYQLLLQQSARLNTTPVELIERLVVNDAAELLIDDTPVRTSQAEALAAVQRLGSLFADVKIDDLEAMLNDPMIQLINVDLDEI